MAGLTRAENTSRSGQTCFLCQPYLVQLNRSLWHLTGWCVFLGGADLNEVRDHWCELNNRTLVHLKGSTLEWLGAVVKATAPIAGSVVFTFPLLVTGGEVLKLWVSKISGKQVKK